MKQLICPENLTFISVISRRWKIYAKLPFLVWNITMLYSFALIMFLHFTHAFPMLSNGRVLLALTWLMYWHRMNLPLSKLELLRAPGVSRYRMYFFFFWYNFVRCLYFYYVIKCNVNDYTGSEHTEYTAFCCNDYC